MHTVESSDHNKRITLPYNLNIFGTCWTLYGLFGLPWTYLELRYFVHFIFESQEFESLPLCVYNKQSCRYSYILCICDGCAWKVEVILYQNRSLVQETTKTHTKLIFYSAQLRVSGVSHLQSSFFCIYFFRDNSQQPLREDASLKVLIVPLTKCFNSHLISCNINATSHILVSHLERYV